MVELSVGAAVVRSYAALRAADAQSLAAQEVFAARDEEAAIIAKRATVGAAGPNEVAQAEVARSAAVAALADSRRTRAAAEHLIGTLTSQPALTIAVRRQDGLRLPAPVAPGLPTDLLANRPDVVAAEQALVAANARIGFVKAARFPTFTLTGAIGSESRELNALFDGATATSTLGVDLRYPLFDFGRGAARVERPSPSSIRLPPPTRGLSSTLVARFATPWSTSGRPRPRPPLPRGVLRQPTRPIALLPSVPGWGRPARWNCSPPAACGPNPKWPWPRCARIAWLRRSTS